MTALKYSKADVIDNRIDQVNKPFQPGGFSNSERNDIPDKTEGLIIFNNEVGALQVFIISMWFNIDVTPV